MEVNVSLKKFWLALIPATFAAISFTLVIISITAGHSAGVMEDYHILYFNTSTLGKNLLSNSNTSDLNARSIPSMPMVTEAPNLLHRYRASPDKRLDIGDLTSEAGDAAGAAASAVTSAGAEGVSAATSVAPEVASAVSSAVSAATSGLEHLVDEATQALETIEDDLADELYKKLGIQQFYSMHLTDLCYGNFTKNATTPGTGFGVTNCTQPLNWTQALDLTGMLNHSLNVGPFQLDLADIGMVQNVTKSIDDVMHTLNSCVEAILAMYIIACLFIGASMVLSVWAVFALTWTTEPGVHKTVSGRTKNIALYSNLATAYLGTGFLLIGNLITTIGGKYVVEKVREHGEGLGLNAYRGGKFLALSWAAFAMVLIAAMLWTFQWATCFLERRAREKRSRQQRMEPKAEVWDNGSVYSHPGSRMMEHL
ncbi:hypothetical protein N0V82_003268 [Gnomoniopsis sp. IMI 355080]|nr:hypothetical protein N0V82_003268 [Gnomoniopsis sp. IMI 355080]